MINLNIKNWLLTEKEYPISLKTNKLVKLVITIIVITIFHIITVQTSQFKRVVIATSTNESHKRLQRKGYRGKAGNQIKVGMVARHSVLRSRFLKFINYLMQSLFYWQSHWYTDYTLIQYWQSHDIYVTSVVKRKNIPSNQLNARLRRNCTRIQASWVYIHALLIK